MSHLVPEPEPRTKSELLREAQQLLDKVENYLADPDALPNSLADRIDRWHDDVDRELDDRHGIY